MAKQIVAEGHNYVQIQKKTFTKLIGLGDNMDIDILMCTLVRKIKTVRVKMTEKVTRKR